MQKAFTILEKTLKAECSRGPVYYFSNPGNWGDGLIRYGTLKFFQDINLHYKELKSAKKKEWLLPFLRGGTVVYGGGGAWCKLWNHSERLVTKLNRRFKVIVLPSSYELRYSIPNVIFFCRDMFESKQNVPDAVFCHDMGFYIGKQFSQKDRGKGKGYFLRGDKEGIVDKIKIPLLNNDISSKGNHFSEISPFFDEINKFSVIYTDRLHVAIAACLLEKEIHLYPGAYFKNRAVFMSSMSDYFDNVYFHEGFDL
jgi:exopolysaccharide biosynthesis predicted pyruvyltransferase EpsI